MKLKNKVVVITGGSGDIGKVVAKTFLQEGATVLIAARDEDDLERAKSELSEVSQEISTCKCDISNSSDVKNLVKAAIERYGRIDVLINAAGTYGPIGPSDKVDLKAWKQTFDVNLFGTFDMIQQVVPHMTSLGKGKIVNFSGGGDGPLRNIAGYNVSKSAVVRLGETLAAEFQERGVNVDINAIAPGAVITKLFKKGLAAGKEALGETTYASKTKQMEEGGVSPQLAADLCVFLASDASDGLTGKFLSAVWDKWREYTPAKIEELMKGDALTVRRKKDE